MNSSKASKCEFIDYATKKQCKSPCGKYKYCMIHYKKFEELRNKPKPVYKPIEYNLSFTSEED